MKNFAPLLQSLQTLADWLILTLQNLKQVFTSQTQEKVPADFSQKTRSTFNLYIKICGQNTVTMTNCLTLIASQVKSYRQSFKKYAGEFLKVQSKVDCNKMRDKWLHCVFNGTIQETLYDDSAVYGLCLG